MCGIAGFVERRRGAADAPLATLAMAMGAAMPWRGPDAATAWADAQAGVAFAHRRLAIVDLTPTGAQPMASASGRYVLCYNGEVYNHGALRADLLRAGATFRGGSDTEVMLAAVEAWGLEAALARFAGMFAFALWDAAERTLHLVRDRLGEKPLYYGWVGERLAFASDLAALRTLPGWDGAIDPEAVDLLLRASYVPAPWSIHAGIRKLPPASRLAIRVDDVAARALPAPVAWWSLGAVAQAGEAAPFTGSDDEAVEGLRAVLRTVVSEQRLADVPVGALLSGGIDSGVVVSLLSELGGGVRTFTMQSDDPTYDESAVAAEVAARLGTRHATLPVSSADALALIPELPRLYTEPFADSSQIPTTLVCRRARAEVTVCLTGDGGDEVFCGYNRHVELARVWSRAGRLPRPARVAAGRLATGTPQGLVAPLLRAAGAGVHPDRVQKLGLMLQAGSLEEAYRVLATHWPAPTPAHAGASATTWVLDTPARWPALSPLGRLLWAESVTSLPDDMLVKVDRGAMSCSLETRAPMLDHRVVEFAWRLPWSMRVRDGRGKWILRQLFGQYVPPAIINRRKLGFSIPLDAWLRGPLRDWAEALLAPAALARSGRLDPAPIRRAWREHLSGRRRWQSRLWSVLMFQAWLEAQG